MKINKQKYELARARACMGPKEVIASGVPKSTFFAVVSGKDSRPETIGKIAKALGVDVTEII